jgi:hypothetical protein
MSTFRIHFYDGERHPLDIEAETPAEAREFAHRRGYTDGQIKKIKLVKEAEVRHVA